MSSLSKPLEFLSSSHCILRGQLQRDPSYHHDFFHALMIEHQYHDGTINLIVGCYCHGLSVCPTSLSNYHHPNHCDYPNIFHQQRGMLMHLSFSNCIILSIVSNKYNMNDKLRLSVDNNCLLTLRYGNDTLKNWGNECDPEMPGVPTFTLDEDANLILKTKQGFITYAKKEGYCRSPPLQSTRIVHESSSAGDSKLISPNGTCHLKLSKSLTVYCQFNGLVFYFNHTLKP